MIDTSEDRQLIILLLITTMVVSGFRFSDGSMLMAISGGADTSHPVFSSNPDAQYLFDSPLKVYLLRILPSNLIVISAFFTLLAILPFVLPFLKPLTGAQRSIVVSFLLLTPISSVSLQNIGVGDGLTIALCLIAVISPSPIIAAASILIISLWHPQQSFFIVTSILIVEFLQRSLISRRSILVACSAFLGFIAYNIYHISLDFEYASRSDFMKSNMYDIVYKNIIYFPIFIAPILAIAYLSRSFLKKLDKVNLSILTFYTLFIILISLFTNDFTRVFFILFAPIIVYLLKNADLELRSRAFLTCFAIVLITPVVSWSGLDIFLYKDIFGDLCKWDIICL